MSQECYPLDPKPAKTYEEQVDILGSRGLFVENRTAAINTLSTLNYYRLSGYSLFFQDKNTEQFYPGSSFSQIIALHELDSKLRIALLEILFDIEITARTRIAYEIGNAWGPMGYNNELNYQGCDHDQFVKLMDNIHNDTARSKELFAQTYNTKYGGQFPIWVAVETMSFGSLSKLYSLIPLAHRRNIAHAYDYLNETLLENWLQAISLLRNICAHNSRILGHPFSFHIQIAQDTKKYVQDVEPNFNINDKSLFAYLLAVQRIALPKEWNTFLATFTTLSNQIAFSKLGLPKKWKKILLPK